VLSFEDIINENIVLRYNKTLNQKLFNIDILKQDIRIRLLKVAEMFRDFCNIKPELVQDIIFTGGNAGYSYNKYSDIDIHLVVDYSKIGHNTIFVADYVYDKKILFSKQHPIKIEGYPTELYVQDIKDHLVASAIYSLKNDMWLVKPQNLNLKYDIKTIEQQSIYFSDLVNELITKKAPIEQLLDVKQKIILLRKQGLESGSEFNVQNLEFKEIRARKILDKIDDYVRKIQDNI
jgi:hypothetical protein